MIPSHLAFPDRGIYYSLQCDSWSSVAEKTSSPLLAFTFRTLLVTQCLFQRQHTLTSRLCRVASTESLQNECDPLLICLDFAQSNIIGHAVDYDQHESDWILSTL